jgi:hypothetical protein
VRLPQLAKLSLASPEQAPAGNHSEAAAHHHSYASVFEPVTALSPFAEEALKSRRQYQCYANQDETSRYAEPNLRSFHTTVHLLQRVSVWRSRRWRDKLDTSIV